MTPAGPPANLHGMKVTLGFLAAATLHLALAAGTLAGGSPNEDVPLDSWVYDAVFELSTQGHFRELLLHTKPYTRGEIAGSLRSLASGSRLLPSGQAVLVERLRSEFAEELKIAEPDSGRAMHRVRFGGGPNSRIDQIRHGVARNRVGFDATGSFSVGHALAVRTRLRTDSDGRHDSQFHGVYWKANFTAWVDQAVLTWRYRNWHGAFGREFWRWGRSPVDALLMSDRSPPFDGLRLSYRTDKWSFSFHATALDTMAVAAVGNINRYLVGHRFDWRLRRNLEIAVSEVVVFGGVNRRWEFHYLNPFLPYYWEQLNQETNDNPLWNLEWSWRPLHPLELYGEWLIDDFQIDFTSEPQQIGILLGLAWTGGPGGRLFMHAEYGRINTFVYGQATSHNRYFHFRDLSGNPIGIGSNLGTDADRVIIRPTWHCGVNLDVIGLFEHVRHGEDRIDSSQAVAVPKNVPFPSGIVERQTIGGFGIHAQLGGHVTLDFLIGYEHVSNVANRVCADREGMVLRLRLISLLWKTVGV